LLLLIGITFLSCSKKDYEAQIPTYISIDKFSLTTDYSTQGSESMSITDVWVYIDDDFVGVYELPANFPILKEGIVTVKLYAGIKENGIAANRTRYLGYAPYVQEVNLVKEETVIIDPQIIYEPTIKFAWLEDFDNASLTFLYNSNSDTIINKNSVDVKEGTFSGQVFLDPDMIFFEATSTSLIGVPLNGSSPVYLEMDFKTNQPLTIGVYLDANQYAFITLNVSTEWRKIYINLSEVISTNNIGATDLKVFFGMQESGSNQFVTNPEIFIDNLKVVHF
tara:strand:- start:3285 stop:4121 length:837 start_codon:yes stop_codon:yes gene_type:complete